MKTEDITSIEISEDEIEISEYAVRPELCFKHSPFVAYSLLNKADEMMKGIEQLLYKSPAFIKLLKSTAPDINLKAVLTNDQKKKLAKGVLKLMTKKDGSLLANLVDPKTNHVVAQVPLQSEQFSPDISNAINNYALQMQMAQIAESIQDIQLSIEEVRQGQEYDRLATAYSCQQKLIQSIAIKDDQLRKLALIGLVSDAEDSRNKLMLSQKTNVQFIIDQPESFFGKLVGGSSPEKIGQRMNEIRENLGAVNMVSLVEALAYNEMGEKEAAVKSLEYYGDYIQNTYLAHDGLVERLDLIDPVPVNYWTSSIPEIKEKIEQLPHMLETHLLEEK